MTKVFLNGLHIITGSQRCNGEGMAEIVEAGSFKSQFRHHQFESTVSRLGCDPSANLVGKYETGIFVAFLKQLTVVVLFCLAVYVL